MDALNEFPLGGGDDLNRNGSRMSVVVTDNSAAGLGMIGAPMSIAGDEREAADAPSPAKTSRRRTKGDARSKVAAGEEEGGGQMADADQMPSAAPDLRFSDPLVMAIVQGVRRRRRWLKARNSLILQGKALGRAMCGVEDEKKSKAAGSALYDAAVAGTCTDEAFAFVVAPFISAAALFDDRLRDVERQLEKHAKRLPVWPWVEGISGFGAKSLAILVGECGDLSAYRTVSGVWKRAGLAVIDGERQRKCADAVKALAHGYSPSRRSDLWNIGEAIARRQRTWADKTTGEVSKEPGPYGVYLEAEKAKQLAKGERPVVAEARAKRHMTKRILRDLTLEWRRIAGRGETSEEAMTGLVSSLPHQIAAE